MISCEANNVGKDKCTSDLAMLAAYLLCCAAPFPTLPALHKNDWRLLLPYISEM